MVKKLIHTIFTLAAALIFTGGFSMTVLAGGGEETPQTQITEISELIETEITQPSDPLTPDGNAILVDDIWGENKQLITVTTKSGNYFYILIDRAAEGDSTVHFLNKVDEADLMALIEDDSAAESVTVTCICTEKCETGNVNENCPVCQNNRTVCTGIEKAENTETKPEPPKKSGASKSLLLLLLVVIIAGGGAFYYFTYLKPKDSTKSSGDFTDFDFEDEDEEPDYEDEPEESSTKETDEDIEYYDADEWGNDE